MEAVFTRYHGPTDHRQSKVVARCPARGVHVVINYDDGLGSDGNHEAALRKLLAKMAASASKETPCAWIDPKDWVAGDAGQGYVFVFRGAYK